MSKNSKSSSSGGKSSSSSSQRKSTFFISGEGIDREVITTDICRYLGNDALVKPGVHQVRYWVDGHSVAVFSIAERPCRIPTPE